MKNIIQAEKEISVCRSRFGSSTTTKYYLTFEKNDPLAIERELANGCDKRIMVCHLVGTKRWPSIRDIRKFYSKIGYDGIVVTKTTRYSKTIR